MITNLKCASCNRKMRLKAGPFPTTSLYRVEIFGHVVSEHKISSVYECPKCGLSVYEVIAGMENKGEGQGAKGGESEI